MWWAKMAKILKPMEGVQIWKNEKNKFVVFRLHYSADEEKRKPEWKTNASSGIPKNKWRQEYEIEWLSFDGEPVYPDWKKAIHCCEHPIDPHLGLPLLIGWDFGLTPAAIVAQMQGNQLMVIKEFIGSNIGIKRFSEHVVSQLKILFPAWQDFKRDWLCFADPAGMFRKDTDEGTCFGYLDRFFSTRPGPVALAARITGVENFLVGMHKGEPDIQVYEPNCPTLVKGFDGGYRYKESALETGESSEPKKNVYSHVHDGFQYLCCGVAGVRLDMHKQQLPVSKPGFGWQRRRRS